MSRMGVVAGVVLVLAGAAVAGFLVVQSKKPDLSPAGPNRELAPASLAFYAELPGLSSTWTKMEGTEAWIDFEASGIARAALELKPVKDLVAAMEQIAAKADYKMTQRNAMKFIGRELSLGLALDPAGGAPHVLVLTKLDVDALVKDLVTGRTDIDSLWDELQRRTGKMDFTVTAAEFKEHKIATAARDGSSYHATLLGDTLAVSTDLALLHQAIECRLAAGERSLGRRPEFKADMAASAPGAAIVEWYDLDAMDKGRASVDAGLVSLGAEPRALTAVHGLLDGTRGAHSFARSTSLPDGDLYRATWSYSKSAELFADKASPALRELASGDWMMYWEMREIGGVAKAWSGSSVRKRLGEGEIGKWLDAAMDEPKKKIEELMRSLPMGRGMRGADMEAPAAGLVDRFSLRMGKHLLSEQIGNLLNGETAAAFDMDAEQIDKPRFVATVRLGTEGRLAALAGEALLLGDKPEWVTVADAGSRKVFTSTKGIDVHFALIGDAIVIGTDGDAVRSAAASGKGAPAGPGKGVADGIAAMKPGWRGFYYLDFAKLRSTLTAAGRDNPSMGPIDQILDLYKKLGVVGDRIAYAGYVADDFSSVEMRTRMWSDGAAAPARASAEREPLVWRSLPKSTFLHSVDTDSGIATLWEAAKLVLTVAGADEKEVSASFREAMEMDLEDEFIPAFGREISFALTYIAAPPAAPEERRAPVVLPGCVLGFEVKDAKVVKKAVDRAIELAESSLEQEGTTEKVFHREAYGGAEVIRVEIPAEARMPVRLSPALVLKDGYLTISTDLDTLRACVDAKDGKAPCLADSQIFKDAAAAVGAKPSTFMLLDWPAMLDQVAVYAPQLGGLVERQDVPFPERPEDRNAQEWQRRLAEYHAKVEASKADAAKAGGEKARKWIDALRVIDFMVAEGRVRGGVTEGAFVVRFTK